MFIVKLVIVINNIERPVCLLEKIDQIIGAYREQPVTAPTLKTTLTIPPTDGTISATIIVPIPNKMVESFATNMI